MMHRTECAAREIHEEGAGQGAQGRVSGQCGDAQCEEAGRSVSALERAGGGARECE